ncbi:hypothetical protein CR513_21147, partial [Mucuna pruriens]
MQKTIINTTLGGESEEYLSRFLTNNQDVFAWTSTDMPRIDMGGAIVPHLARQRCHGQKAQWQIANACLKDPYPLLNIDQLVDGASNCGFLSFMDTYSRYNQIKMHPCNEAKTAFITNKGTFCYKLMDKIFKDVAGRDMEVYVDDIVVKSTTTGEYYDAIG